MEDTAKKVLQREMYKLRLKAKQKKAEAERLDREADQIEEKLATM